MTELENARAAVKAAQKACDAARVSYTEALRAWGHAVAAQAKHAAGVRAASISRDPADVKESAELFHEEMTVQEILASHEG